MKTPFCFAPWKMLSKLQGNMCFNNDGDYGQNQRVYHTWIANCYSHWPANTPPGCEKLRFKFLVCFIGSRNWKFRLPLFRQVEPPGAWLLCVKTYSCWTCLGLYEWWRHWLEQRLELFSPTSQLHFNHCLVSILEMKVVLSAFHYKNLKKHFLGLFWFREMGKYQNLESFCGEDLGATIPHKNILFGLSSKT